MAGSFLGWQDDHSRGLDDQNRAIAADSAHQASLGLVTRSRRPRRRDRCSARPGRSELRTRHPRSALMLMYVLRLLLIEKSIEKFVGTRGSYYIKVDTNALDKWSALAGEAVRLRQSQLLLALAARY